ncbi:uncharacterized protein LACBIDRAFT_300766 [Laccaria bicolor S238N-H82]|uniref:NUDE domain-containing protein n=1 Tax=Laccaria bicolor (strain S238N-H82 / ATCC MYA-4686) TaxID=486041 RepID=B0CQH1_LACBS|nr:uncharacterized protein LACBIDRAFT_300766 [Laccaria bicolor S238N-H82]EDR15644.1 hypothetical protein LACBIDRAFT_300766 [Laccaria bicolor S238N-H82]|eukprot:XP_001873852.1 hypothetical protein LACBIDRAFT_300766 [Laccaria bicolor S238N-H82]
MTAVLSPTDPLRKDRYTSLEDNGISYAATSTDWREKYNEVLDMLAETRAELDDFHHASKELEAELENELQRTEKAQQDLKVKVAKSQNERDEWKTKFMSLQTTHNTTTTSLQRELDQLRQKHQQTKVHLRELEMGNDDLERNERAVSSSLADMEAKYSRALEEKILLEHELLEKANLEEETQRLKDELRDANVEISILKDQLASLSTENGSLKSLSVQYPATSTASDDNLLKTAPPADLELADLSPSSDSVNSMYSTPKATPSSRSTFQSTLFQRASFQQNKNSPLQPLKTSDISRSITLPSMYSPSTSTSNSTSRVPTTRGTPLRTISTNSAITGTSSKNKGVQMVSEMRARVKNLEQKIHTRVPRLRMASITGRANTMAPSPIPVSASSSSSVSNASTAKTSWESQRKSVDSRRSQDSEAELQSRKDVKGDSSGWVLIMEDSPSPQHNKEKDRQKDRRRLSSPTAPTAFRPTASTNGRPPSPSLSTGRPGSLAQTVASTGLRRPQSRLSANSLSAAASSPTTASRPATPTFLPVPSGSSLYAPSSGLGLKRSTGPGAPNPYNQLKRSSLGQSTNAPSSTERERPTTMPPLPRLGSNPTKPAKEDVKALPDFLGLHTNITMRPPKLPTSSGNAALSKSRIGRPSSTGLSGRKSSGEPNNALDIQDLRPRSGSTTGGK